ncbi:hypothetical protein M1116_04065 [Patescibacteria group bacterium]|nr:hypothetical protein [Patescibacteria group bacterium]
MKNFVVFGASGDLAKNYIYPALANLLKTGLEFDYWGYGRTPFTPSEFTALVAAASGRDLASRFHYLSGPYSLAGLALLKTQLRYPDSIFYLGIPTSPELVTDILSALLKLHLISPESMIAIEKPFGFDLPSARLLMNRIRSLVDFEQVFLVDHYLTKELVKNIISLRFANPVLESVWDRFHIKSLEITATETRGIDNRGQYYDRVGALRDMIQNHVLQLIALITMAQPTGISTPAFAAEKLRILKKIRLFNNDFSANVRTGQYQSYLQEKDVHPHSTTETFVQLNLEVNTPQWRGVLIRVVTGKKLEQKSTEIKVIFQNNLRCLWGELCPLLTPNQLIINIYPHNEIRLVLNSEFNPSRVLPQAVDFRLGYSDEKQLMHTAYENVITDIANRDRINSPTYPEILAQWQLIDTIRQHPEFSRHLFAY